MIFDTEVHEPTDEQERDAYSEAQVRLMRTIVASKFILVILIQNFL